MSLNQIPDFMLSDETGNVKDKIAVLSGAGGVVEKTNKSEFDVYKADYTKLLPVDITKHGAVGDGATNCLTAFNAAVLALSVNGVLKFPQNATNNAIYYFLTNPTLSGLKIDCDDDVILSFATTNGISFKDVTFLNDISITSRDRNNTGLQLTNNYSDLLFNTLTDNDVEVGVKKLSTVTDANIQKKIYTIAGGLAVSDATLAFDSATGMYYMANVGDIPNATNKIATLEFDFIDKNMYTCDFEFAVAETNSTFCVGITATLDYQNWSFYAYRYLGSTKYYQTLAGVTTNPTTRSVGALVNDAYIMKKGYVMSARPIGNNKIEIYLNGFYVETITIPFTFTKLGFGVFTISATVQGLQNTQWGRVVKGECLKSNRGDTLNLLGFGDSFTVGEGTLSWFDYLPKFLTGQKGITKVSVVNYADSGDTAAAQLAVMQGVSFTSSHNKVLILIGTNDIQAQTDLATFKTTVQSMITLAKSAYRKVILGIPPMFLDSSVTGVGANTSDYEKGSAYRSVLMQLVAENDIYVADTFSEIGRIGTDNILNTLRDNIHPNEFGQILIARCFARSILSAVTEDA